MGFQTIKVNHESLLEESDTLKKEIINQIITEFPTVEGSGDAVDKINQLAKTMKSLYEETINLIKETEQTLEKIGLQFEKIDEKAATNINKIE